MHNFFSENRLIAQNMPEAPRAPVSPEAARQENEVQRLFALVEQKGRELMQSITPEQRQQLENVGRELLSHLGEIRSTFFDAVRQELPRLGQYAQLGGQFGNRAPGMQWNPAQQSLQLDPSVFGFTQQSFPFNVGNNGRQDVMVIDRGGQASVVDVFGDDWDAMFGDGDSWIIDQDGMHEIDNIYSDADNQYVEQNAAQTGTRSALDDLRAQMPQQPVTLDQMRQRPTPLSGADKDFWEKRTVPGSTRSLSYAENYTDLMMMTAFDGSNNPEMTAAAQKAVRDEQELHRQMEPLVRSSGSPTVQRYFADRKTAVQAYAARLAGGQQPAAPAAERPSNLPLRPGETKETRRIELQQQLAKAKQEFDTQRVVVEQLRANTATPPATLKAAQDKLVELQLEVVGIEGQIKALDGGTQANPV